MRVAQKLLQHRQPMIKFIGKRTPPATIDHSAHAHPASPSTSLPESFATYRQKAQQHGPLGGQQFASASTGRTGRTGASLGPVAPSKGQYFDRNELPQRYRRTPFTPEEIDAIETGGASVFG